MCPERFVTYVSGHSRRKLALIYPIYRHDEQYLGWNPRQMCPNCIVRTR
jgi:hypothetical protein